MKRSWILPAVIGALAALSSGCTTHTFSGPMTISTKSAIAKHVTPIKPVEIKRNVGFYVIFPKVFDPRTGFDDLIQEARLAGGDCIIDFQIRQDSMFAWLFPPVIINDIKYTGTAARLNK